MGKKLTPEQIQALPVDELDAAIAEVLGYKYYALSGHKHKRWFHPDRPRALMAPPTYHAGAELGLMMSALGEAGLEYGKSAQFEPEEPLRHEWFWPDHDVVMIGQEACLATSRAFLCLEQHGEKSVGCD